MKLTHRIAYWLLKWPMIPYFTRWEVEREIFGHRCVCGVKKMPGRPVCKACFATLSKTLKKRLSAGRLRRRHILAYLTARDRLRKQL